MDKKESEKTTIDLRNELKKLYARELPKLPGYFNMLQPNKKLDFLLKFAPYVLPRVDSVSHRAGESDEFNIDVYG